MIHKYYFHFFNRLPESSLEERVAKMEEDKTEINKKISEIHEYILRKQNKNRASRSSSSESDSSKSDDSNHRSSRKRKRSRKSPRKSHKRVETRSSSSESDSSKSSRKRKRTNSASVANEGDVKNSDRESSLNHGPNDEKMPKFPLKTKEQFDEFDTNLGLDLNFKEAVVSWSIF